MANFQSIVPVKLGQAVISSILSTLYTVPSVPTNPSRTLVKDIDICNTSANSVQVTVYLVPAGSTAGIGNELIPGVVIPPNGMLQWSGTQVLNGGDTIQHIATSTGCTINASGGEAT